MVFRIADPTYIMGTAVAEWLRSWLAEQEVRGSIPRLATWISEIGYLLPPSRDVAEIPLKRRKSSIQPTNQILHMSLHIYKHVKLFTLLTTDFVMLIFEGLNPIHLRFNAWIDFSYLNGQICHLI